MGWTFAQPAGVTTKSVGLAIRGTGASVNAGSISYFNRADATAANGEVQLLLGVQGGTATTTFTVPAGKWTLRGLTAPWQVIRSTTLYYWQSAIDQLADAMDAHGWKS